MNVKIRKKQLKNVLLCLLFFPVTCKINLYERFYLSGTLLKQKILW